MPLWILSLVGLLFFIAGVCVIVNQYTKKEGLIHSLLLSVFALFGYGFGFFTDNGLFIKIVMGAFSTLLLVWSIKILTRDDK